MQDRQLNRTQSWEGKQLDWRPIWGQEGDSWGNWAGKLGKVCIKKGLKGLKLDREVWWQWVGVIREPEPAMQPWSVWVHSNCCVASFPKDLRVKVTSSPSFSLSPLYYFNHKTCTSHPKQEEDLLAVFPVPEWASFLEQLFPNKTDFSFHHSTSYRSLCKKD